MKLVRSIKLERPVEDLLTIEGGVVVLTSGDDGCFLECYDADLTPIWCKRLGQKALALCTAHRQQWLLDVSGMRSFDQRGEWGTVITGGRHPGMRVGAFAAIEDGFVLAWEHSGAEVRSPILERIRLDHPVTWSVTFPVHAVEYEGVITMRADENWKARPMSPWAPQTWYLTSRRLTLSGDALLACYWEMPRSGIGFGYAISLADGSLRFHTEVGPIHKVGSLGNGAFLVGYYGYGAFHTLGYERDGRDVNRWPSHGHYLVGDDVRVLELDNSDPWRTHLVRLLPEGELQTGDILEGYWSSTPLCTPDGTAYYLLEGTLLAVRGLAVSERLRLAGSEKPILNQLSVGEQCLFLAYTTHYLSVNSTTTLARVDL